MRFQLTKCVKLKINVLVEIHSQKAKQCQTEPTPKNRLKKNFQTARLCQTEKIYQAARTKITKKPSKRKTLKNRTELSKLKNCR